MITRDEIEAWLKDPVTELVHEALRKEINDLREYIGSGATLDLDNAAVTAQQTAYSAGEHTGLTKALETVIEDLIDDRTEKKEIE